MKFEVFCEWDEEAKLWYVAESNVPGLSAEAPTCKAMTELLNRRIPELLQLNMPEYRGESEVPLELLYKERHTLAVHC